MAEIIKADSDSAKALSDRNRAAVVSADSLESRQAGVQKVEAAQKVLIRTLSFPIYSDRTDTQVWGKWSRIALITGLTLACYVYSLDGFVLEPLSFFFCTDGIPFSYVFYTWLFVATSSFGHHSLLGSITTAQGIIGDRPLLTTFFRSPLTIHLYFSRCREASDGKGSPVLLSSAERLG
jgi:hypothetical protein